MHSTNQYKQTEIGETVRILAERLVLPAEPVAGRDTSEPLQVHHVQRADVVAASLQVVAPVALLPEPDPFGGVKEHFEVHLKCGYILRTQNRFYTLFL